MTVASVLSIVESAANAEGVVTRLRLGSRDKSPSTPPDWQVLLSGYAPFAIFAAVCVIGRVLLRPTTPGAAVTR